MAVTTDTKKIERKQSKAASLGRGGCSTERQKVRSEMAALLCKQSPAEWLSLLEDIAGADVVVMEELYSVTTFESLLNLYLERLILLLLYCLCLGK